MMIRAGLVRYVVAGGFPPWRVVDSIHRSSTRNHARFEALQAEYSLVSSGCLEREALAMCREHRLGFLARSPLAGGFLAQRSLSLRELMNPERGWPSERFGNNSGDVVLNVLMEIADKRLVTSAQVALAWVLQNSQVSSAVISATTVPELRELIGAAEVILTADEMGALTSATTVQDYRQELRHV
jgi:aryl-alcohol dehydrogenase-like predicted oxidoreductase